MSLPAAEYMPRLHETKCSDTKALAAEAVAYSLVGAWEPYTDRKCFQAETFRHFNPRAGKPEGDVFDPSKILRFDKTKDKYEIESVKKEADGEYAIAVKFTLAGKPLQTVYKYVPDPAYTGRTGICGFVVNETHTIIRSDCFDAKKWDATLKAAKP